MGNIIVCWFHHHLRSVGCERSMELKEMNAHACVKSHCLQDEYLPKAVRGPTTPLTICYRYQRLLYSHLRTSKLNSSIYFEHGRSCGSCRPCIEKAHCHSDNGPWTRGQVGFYFATGLESLQFPAVPWLTRTHSGAGWYGYSLRSGGIYESN